jgi:hypothetical protein
MGGGTLPASRRVGLTCQQTRPNRNHHCPLVVGRGSISVKRLRDLPCRPRACRLNMLVDAHHRRARGGEVVLVGADKPDGSIKGGLARLNASIASDGANVTSVDRRTTRRRTRTLPASFDGGYQVVYSQRMNGLRAGDVLLVRAGQRTAIERYAYFIANRVVIATRPGERWPGRLPAGSSRRLAWRPEPMDSTARWGRAPSARLAFAGRQASRSSSERQATAAVGSGRST